LKKLNWTKYRVHAVTSAELLAKTDFFARAAELAATGCVAINLRAHGLSGSKIYETALRLREMTRRVGAFLVVNDRIDVALAAGADGVHLGARSIPLARAVELCRSRGLGVGYSCHDLGQAEAAARAGADYLYLGTVFHSAGKPGTVPCGTAILAEVCRGVPVPVFGIGGIDPGNIRQIAEAGASGAAVITAAWEALDFVGNVRLMGAAFD